MATLEQTLDQYVASVLATVPQVEAVYVDQTANKLIVYTVIDESDESVYDRIYDCERHLIRDSNGAQFDFNVTARRGVPVETLLGDLRPVWQRGASDECRTHTNT
jgi:hypothetical protein